MTSGVRLLLREVALWFAVFVSALAGFVYLDGSFDSFFANRPGSGWFSTSNSSEHGNDESAIEEVSRTPVVAPRQEPEDDEESSPGRVILRAGNSGHFEVKSYINNRPVDLMADTGATYVVLTWDDARSLGITGDLEFTGRARTANGVSRVAPVLLEKVEVGDIMIKDVKAIVSERGSLDTSLLGMSFIGRLRSFQMSGRKLVLEN